MSEELKRPFVKILKKVKRRLPPEDLAISFPMEGEDE